MTAGLARAVMVLGMMAVGLGACGGASVPSHYYVLSPSAAPASPGATASGPAVELARVAVPDYLNQPSIVTRSQANEVQRAEYDRWAGPLGDEIVRTLSENLSLTLPTDRLFVGGARPATPADFVVDVDIVTFERDAAGTVHLIARWSVFRDDGKELVAMHRSVYQQAAGGTDYASTAAAMSRALGDLSVDIANAIKKGANTGRSASSDTRSTARRPGP